jgi:hypothetical protein
VKLDPETYSCQKHRTDLTGQVTEALDDDVPPLAYDRLPILGRASARPRPFEVTVTCPGTGGSGPHDLVCTGTRTR